MGKKKMTKEEMRDAAWAEYREAIAPAWDEYDKATAPAEAKYNKVRDAMWAKLQNRLAEINAMPDDGVDPEVQKAIKLLKSKGATISFDK